ncbi:hydroxysteroid (20-beta) dehydrogenase 2 [Synchiropus picturatus]
MSLFDLLHVVALLVLAQQVLKMLWSCFNCFKQYFLSEIWRTDVRKFGRWAVITGSTSGIGKAYALELAKRGLDIVLVGRSEQKLQQVAKEIEETHGRKTISIQVDFTEGKSIYPTIAKGLQGLEVGILVNNVGMTFSEGFDRFLDVPDLEQRINNITDVNVLSVMQMTRIVLPGMVERESGLIINLSSIAAVKPQPLLATYAASKIFITYFSESLHTEYKSKGITVQNVAPGLVSTNMTNNIPRNFMVKSADAFVREALNTVGYSMSTNGCFIHFIQVIVFKCLFPDVLRLSTWHLNKQIELGRTKRTGGEKSLHKKAE